MRQMSMKQNRPWNVEHDFTSANLTDSVRVSFAAQLAKISGLFRLPMG